LCLQPFDRHLDGKDGDLAMAKNVIDLALKKSPNLHVYVYARWPRQGKDDFDTAWQKEYTGKWDNTNESKDYFERLTLKLRKAYPKLKINMVPVGHVMYELNQRMKAGQVPGYTHIKQLFADGIHLNNVGSYVVGCTFFATLYRQNSKGLPLAPYKVEDAKLAGIIQDVVWKVVSTNELAGILRLLEITWSLRKGVHLFYDVSQGGDWYNARNVVYFAVQANQNGQFSEKDLADLRGLLPKLPKSAAKPPIERTVAVSCERDGRWCTETYDSSHIPETLEKIMLILGERFETKDRKHDPTEKASQ
jgi:hypothetical protein